MSFSHQSLAASAGLSAVRMLIWGLSMAVVGAVVCWLAFTVLGLP